MKTLSKQEAVPWCQTMGIALSEQALPDRAGADLNFKIPEDAQKRIALAKQAMEAFTDEPAILVWFNDWAVWPSGQRMHIFDRLRLSYGETRQIIDAPAQLFRREELEDAISFVVIAVLFLWDCYVLCPNPNRFLFFSHDEYGMAGGASSSEANKSPERALRKGVMMVCRRKAEMSKFAFGKRSRIFRLPVIVSLMAALIPVGQIVIPTPPKAAERSLSSAETAAVSAARDYVATHFPEFDTVKNPPLVHDNGDTWEVEYELPKGTLGGTPVIVIDKKTLEVLRSSHTQ